MSVNSVFAIISILAIFGPITTGFSVIPGKYDVYNHKSVHHVEFKKNLFGYGANRAPAHDTPPSSCKCSKWKKYSSIQIFTMIESS